MWLHQATFKWFGERNELISGRWAACGLVTSRRSPRRCLGTAREIKTFLLRAPGRHEGSPDPSKRAERLRAGRAARAGLGLGGWAERPALAGSHGGTKPRAGSAGDPAGLGERCVCGKHRGSANPSVPCVQPRGTCWNQQQLPQQAGCCAAPSRHEKRGPCRAQAAEMPLPALCNCHQPRPSPSLPAEPLGSFARQFFWLLFAVSAG